MIREKGGVKMKKGWRIEIFRDKDKQCRIRMRASNGKIIMSSEAYSSKQKALKTVKSCLAAIWTLEDLTF